MWENATAVAQSLDLNPTGPTRPATDSRIRVERGYAGQARRMIFEVWTDQAKTSRRHSA